MAEQKTRREFLRKASLAGVALVAGGAGLSAEGCTKHPQVDVAPGGSGLTEPVCTPIEGQDLVTEVKIDSCGVITITDPAAAQRLLDTLKQSSGAGRKLTDLAQSGKISLQETPRTVATRGNNGIRVSFTATDVDLGVVPVNSLCGCNTKC